MSITLKKGFTLLEILLVIGIIAVLAGIVIMAINPSRQLAQVRNTQRRLNINEIDKALKQYYIDNHSYPDTISTTLTEICNTGTATTSTNCDNLADLSFLVPTYLTSIPTDPQATSTTGYLVMKNSNNKLYITASNSELDSSIGIGNPPPVWACGDSLIDTRDSQSYATVLIGSQCWMQENLNVGTMVAAGTNQTDNFIIEKNCYNNLESNCNIYGGLYKGIEVSDYTFPATRDICPMGWHVPTDNEFKTLEMYLGMTQEQANLSNVFRGTTEGDELKNTGLCQGRIPCGTSGFNALLAGYSTSGGSFYPPNYEGYFFFFNSSGFYNHRVLSKYDSKVYQTLTNMGIQNYSVRCLKD